MVQKIFAVLGLGLFGTSIARTLTEEGHDVIALDKNMDHVEEIADIVDQAIRADFTKFEQLKESGVGDCDIAIIATSSRLEDAIIAILNLQRLGVENIIVKSKNAEYRDVLLKVGATRVVLPEVEMGIRIGKELANPLVHELMDLDHENYISAFEPLPDWIGKRVAAINFEDKYGINIIGIRQNGSAHFKVDFERSYIIQAGDELIGISKEDNLKRIFYRA